MLINVKDPCEWTYLRDLKKNPWLITKEMKDIKISLHRKQGHKQPHVKLTFHICRWVEERN